MAGTWTLSGSESHAAEHRRPEGLPEPGALHVHRSTARASASPCVADDCKARQDDSRSQPLAAARHASPRQRRGASCARRAREDRRSARRRRARATGRRSADAKRPASPTGRTCPTRWNPATGENILWRTPIPGLAALEPDRVGRHDLRHQRDQQPQGCDVQARALRRRRRIRRSIGASLDALRDRQADAARSAGSAPRRKVEPRNKRHIKSTYASASPATDGRIVVAWFGSQGIHAYDFDGGLRWSVDLGRVDMGAYDIPAVSSGARRARRSSGTAW